MAAAQAYVWDMVPRESLPGVIVNGLILALQAMVLPRCTRFNASTAWGSLRPAERRQ